MPIIIRPTNDGSGRGVVDLRKALEVLRAANIQTEGGGTLGRDEEAYGVIELVHETDVRRAIVALNRAGIAASE